MRFSAVLYKVNYHRHFQRIWKRQSRLQTPELQIPEELKEMGVNIKDAKIFLLETKMFPPEREVVCARPSPPSALHQGKYFYLMNSNTQISESENQTLALTKTLPYRGLPGQLQSLVGVDSLPNQDELVQTSLLQAQIWDGDQYKLPKIVDPKRPGYNFRRVYGIRKEKKVAGLLEKLVFLCDGVMGKYPACFLRDKVTDAFCDLSIERNGCDVTFQMLSDIMSTSSEPLKRFASASEVAATVDEHVPDIYPIKPTLDLEKFEERLVSPSIPRFNNRYIHTLFVAQRSDDDWSPKQMLSRAIGTCFSFSAKEARMKYGADVKLLPEPICVQSVYMDMKSFNFLAYQLNTLELEHNDGIKNQVWIDEPTALYDQISETNHGQTTIADYNPEVFSKLLGLYLNGLHPSLSR